jgi:hypothetical protein
VSIHPCGCGEKADELEFVVPVHSGVRIGGHAHIRTIGDSGMLWRAPIVRLDEEISEPVSFIKCDIEGAELFAVRGAQNLIRKYHPVILCEIEERWLTRFGLKPNDLFDFARSFDYSISQVGKGDYVFSPPLMQEQK